MEFARRVTPHISTKMAACEHHEAQRPRRLCNLEAFFQLLTGLFTQMSTAVTSYSRQDSLDIKPYNSGSFITGLQLIPESSRKLETAHSSRVGGSARRWCRDHKQRWGIRGGLQARLMSKSKSNVMILTKTYLNSSSPDSAIGLAGHYTHRADRTADGSSKTRGGGLCIHINNAWCTDSIITERYCSPNVEFLMVKCRPYYLPSELTSVIVTAVYIPPDANAKLAMNELHAAISKQQTNAP